MSQIPQKLIQQRDADELASGYGGSIRWLEISSIVAWFALVGWIGYRLWTPALANPWMLVSAAICAYLAADFISGFVHWAADTWGSADMPVIGNALIRPFREHHVDQKAITRHDFVETNGNNCLISLPTGLLALAVPLDAASPGSVFLCGFLAFLMVWVLCTNQFHKWSHLDVPPRFVNALQRMHLILPVDHHQVHHTAPYERSYCITVGWLNGPLNRMGFFRVLERMVTATTGALPRRDDIGERAAKALVAEDEAALSPVDAIPELAPVPVRKS